MTNNFNIPTEYLTDDEMSKLGEIVNRLDDLLVKLFPNIFCLGRRVVLKKKN